MMWSLILIFSFFVSVFLVYVVTDGKPQEVVKKEFISNSR